MKHLDSAFASLFSSPALNLRHEPPVALTPVSESEGQGVEGRARGFESQGGELIGADGLTSFVCPRHQWASAPRLDRLNIIAVCPLCVVEIEERIGRDRYRALHARLAARA